MNQPHQPHQHEGREVSKVFWPSSDGEIITLKSDKDVKLVFHSEFMGDHTENWILHIENGREVARHNTRFIETITWHK